MQNIRVPVQMKLGGLRAAADYLATRTIMIDGKERGFRLPANDVSIHDGFIRIKGVGDLKCEPFERIEGVTEALLVTDGEAVSENENWVVEFLRRP
jgi:hypothetical protein